MRGAIAGDRDEDASPLFRVAPDAELPDLRLQHLVGISPRPLATPYALTWRSAPAAKGKLKMPRHELCRTIYVSLPVERVEQSDPDRLLIRKQIVEPLPALAWNTGRWYVEVAAALIASMIPTGLSPSIGWGGGRGM